jgi:hypothetical protein
VHQKVVVVLAGTLPGTPGSNEPKASVDVAELNLHVPTTFAVTVTVLVSAANATPVNKTKPKTIAKLNNFFIFLLLLF